MGWDMVRLGKIANVKGGKRLPKGHGYSSVVTKHPYLRVCDFESGTIDDSHLEYIEDDTQELIKRYTIDVEDVYISIAGTIGLVGQVPLHLSGANLTENAAKISLKKSSKLYSKFLVWYLQTLGKRIIDQKTKATSQPKLALFRIEEIQIPLPPLEEQKRIVELLDQAQSLIDKRKEQIELIDQLIQSLFYDMFGDPVTNSHRFSTECLEQTCAPITKGTTPRRTDIHENQTEKSIPFLKVYHLTDNGKINFQYKPSFISQGTHDERLKRSKVYPGDVLMNIVGPPLGKIALVDSQYSEWNINQALAIFRCMESLHPVFLLWTLKSETFLRTIIDQAIGIRQLNLSLK